MNKVEIQLNFCYKNTKVPTGRTAETYKHANVLHNPCNIHRDIRSFQIKLLSWLLYMLDSNKPFKESQCFSLLISSRLSAAAADKHRTFVTRARCRCVSLIAFASSDLTEMDGCAWWNACLLLCPHSAALRLLLLLLVHLILNSPFLIYSSLR